MQVNWKAHLRGATQTDAGSQGTRAVAGSKLRHAGAREFLVTIVKCIARRRERDGRMKRGGAPVLGFAVLCVGYR
jgi:hypothetical protein